MAILGFGGVKFAMRNTERAVTSHRASLAECILASEFESGKKAVSNVKRKCIQGKDMHTGGLCQDAYVTESHDDIVAIQWVWASTFLWLDTVAYGIVLYIIKEFEAPLMVRESAHAYECSYSDLPVID